MWKILVVAALISFCADCNGWVHHYGEPEPGDSIVHYKEYKGYGLRRFFITPQLLIEKHKSVITQIIVDTKGEKRAKSFIWSGGIGENNIELQVDIKDWEDDVDVIAYAI